MLSDVRVRSHHVAVWAALDSFCTKVKRECYPSQALLVQRSKCSDATLRRKLRDLEVWGYIEVARYTNGNLRSRNRYRLLRSVTVTDRQTHDQTDQPVTVTDRSGHSDRNNRSHRPEQSVSLTVSTKKAPIEGSQRSRSKAEGRKRPFIPPTIEETKAWASGKGWRESFAQSFFDYFTADADRMWIDSKGNPVKSWKQKMQTWASRQSSANNGKGAVLVEREKTESERVAEFNADRATWGG